MLKLVVFVPLVLLACGSGSKGDTAGSTAPTTPTGDTPPGTATGGTASGTPTASATPCEVEAALADAQAALGLTAQPVCADLVDLGDRTLLDAGVVPPGTDWGAVLGPDALPHRSEFEGTRRLWGYGDHTISVASGSAADTELAVLTAQALAALQTDVPDAAAWLDELGALPTEPTLDCCAWRNRYDRLVVSLDATPIDVGAAVAVLGVPSSSAGEETFVNTALISLDRETIAGGDPDRGSRAIYGAADDRENLLRYFADGAAFTLLHEVVHLTITQRNSVSEVANWIWAGRTYVNDAYVNAEEVIANASACAVLHDDMSPEMQAFNERIQANLLSLGGVPERLDELRGMSNAGSPRLVLTPGPGCGG